MIIYPLSTPAQPGPRHFKLIAVDAVGETISPFSGSAQEQQWPDAHWELEYGLPPILRSNPISGQWTAFLAALRGKYGSFLMGDPLGATPKGSALLQAGLTQPYTGTPPANPTNPATVGASGAGGGLIVPWTNPNDIAADIGYASVTLGAGRIPAVLSASSFGFAVPSPGLAIVGIEVLVTAYCSAAGAVFNASLSSGSAGSLIESVELGTAAGIDLVFGGQTDTWGSTIWTPSLLNSNGFTVSFYPTAVPAGATIYARFGRVALYLQSANQAGTTALYLSGFQPNQSGLLLPGDYLQPPTVTVPRLYMATSQGDSDANGNVAIDCFPPIRESLAAGSVSLTNTVGTFRLKQNNREWDADQTRTVQISFKGREAI